jgi:hypothetical protein
MEFRCPNCNAPIYSRKLKICGVCEKLVPPELLLSESQTAFLKKQEAEVEKRAKAFGQQLNDAGPQERSGGLGY